MKPPIFLTALLLLAKGCEVLAQRVDCFSKSSPGLYATSFVQPTGQISVPAVITPTPAPTPVVSTYSDYRNCPLMPPSMPPIVITRDDDDDWYHLMYFLILALSKNRDRDCGYGYNNDNCGCGGNCGCNCGGNNYLGNDCSCNSCGNYGYRDCGCDNYGCGGGSSGCGCCGASPYDSFANYGGNNIKNCGNEIRYIPFPIAVPMNFPYCFPSFSYPDDTPSKPDFYPTPGSSLPPCNCNCNCGDSNELCLTITTSDCQ